MTPTQSSNTPDVPSGKRSSGWEDLGSPANVAWAESVLAEMPETPPTETLEPESSPVRLPAQPEYISFYESEDRHRQESWQEIGDPWANNPQSPTSLNTTSSLPYTSDGTSDSPVKGIL